MNKYQKFYSDPLITNRFFKFNCMFMKNSNEHFPIDFSVFSSCNSLKGQTHHRNIFFHFSLIFLTNKHKIKKQLFLI